MQPLVEILALRKTYGAFVALEGVNAEVQRGEVVCIIGPSGSGKSTLLRCINHLETPDGGLVKVSGETIGYRQDGNVLRPLSDKELSRQRTKIGMVFQQFNLFPHMTALENVTEGPIQVLRHTAEAARTTARQMLDRVGLLDRADHYPGQLSGGQQQRVAIARALAMKPELILFDEPTSALDPELVGEVLQVMRDMAQSGLTMIVVTHEIGFAREVADRIIFMDRGNIVETGEAKTLLSEPKQERTRAFLSAVRAG